MVQPTNFGSNLDAIKDNFFMEKDDNPEQTKKDALVEFNNFTDKLKQKGVDVTIYQQCHEKATDSIFPNNWFSTHKNINIPGKNNV